MLRLVSFSGWLSLASLLLLFTTYVATLGQPAAVSSGALAVLDDAGARSALVSVFGGDDLSREVVNSDQVYQSLVAVKGGADPAVVRGAVVGAVTAGVGVDVPAVVGASEFLFQGQQWTTGKFLGLLVTHQGVIIKWGWVVVGGVLGLSVLVKGRNWWRRGRRVARWALTMGLVPLFVVQVALPVLAAVTSWSWAAVLTVFAEPVTAGFVGVWQGLLLLAGLLWVGRLVADRARWVRTTARVRHDQAVKGASARTWGKSVRALPETAKQAQ